MIYPDTASITLHILPHLRVPASPPPHHHSPSSPSPAATFRGGATFRTGEGKSKMLTDGCVCVSMEPHVGTLGVCSHHSAQTQQMLRGGPGGSLAVSGRCHYFTLHRPASTARRRSKEERKEERCTALESQWYWCPGAAKQPVEHHQ